MAVVDRNFVGWAREIFSDSGKYVLHFGQKLEYDESTVGAAPHQLEAQTHDSMQKQIGQVEEKKQNQIQQAKEHIQVVNQSTDQTNNQRDNLTISPNQSPATVDLQESRIHELDGRSLNLDERALALAMAIAIDYDYFSRNNNGIMHMLNPMPMPYPGGAPIPVESPLPAPVNPSPDSSQSESSQESGPIDSEKDRGLSQGQEDNQDEQSSNIDQEMKLDEDKMDDDAPSLDEEGSDWSDFFPDD